MKTLMVLSALFCLLPARAVEVQNTSSFTDPRTGVTVVRGEVNLPADEFWHVVPPATNACVAEVMLKPPQKVVESMKGSRFQRAEQARALREGRQQLSSLYWSCRRHAELNDGRGPADWAELSTNLWQHLQSCTNNYFLIPKTPILRADKSLEPSAALLAVELTPALNDGQHWVLLSDGQCIRRRIDPELVAKYKLVIQPGKNTDIEPAAQSGTVAANSILALHRGGAEKSVALVFEDRKGRQVTGTWNLAGSTPGKKDIHKEWSQMREGGWAYLAAQTDDFSILSAWLESRGARDTPAFSTRRRGEETDIFGILGGRAALRETLQMQEIVPRGDVSNATDIVKLEDIPGVEVKSHPFGEMLKGGPGATLPLAAWTPCDRLYINFIKPSALLPMLGEGNEFLFRMGLPVAGNNINYNLKKRTLARLGMSEEWLKLAISSGAVEDLALLLPDLFLIDGTDVTVLAKLSSATAFQPLLKAVGAADLATGIARVPLGEEGFSYWAMSGSVLVVGTHRAEVESVLELGRKGGAGSLGQSEEFRYMLTQMPVGKNTRALAYVSDPFIRSLVGPRTKIAQLRRLVARRDLETITCAALLHRADGQPGTPDIRALVAKGYLPQKLGLPDYTIRPDLVAVSATYGTLARPKTLLDVPLENITRREAEAYGRYLENYTRFWQQFFDPIAMRLDDEPDAGLSLTTFILPLLDSTIYNSIKQFVAAREDTVELALPEAMPQPVMQFSLNLKEQAWQDVAESMADDIGRRIHLDPVIFDELGPAVHFAVLDGDPVLALGSSDLLGAFGGGISRMRGSEMFMIPMAASILTRPCVLMVQLRNPEVVIKALNNASVAPFMENRWDDLSFSYYQMEGRDRWVCSIDLFGFARMRLGIEVRDGLLLLDNLPWSPWPDELKMRASTLNGVALAVRPAAAREQLAALFTSAMETERKAAMQGVARLQPVMLCGAADAADAIAKHAAWFGFAPKHPGKGEWIWKDGVLGSSTFGQLSRQIQPAHEKGSRAFGVFSDVDELKLSLQFEDTGLRVRAEWR